MGCTASAPATSAVGAESLTARNLKQLSKKGSRAFGRSSGGDGEDPSGLRASRGGSYKFRAFTNRFDNLAAVTAGLREAGLESSNLIVAVDYTKSNLWQTRFGPQGLHTILPGSSGTPGSPGAAGAGGAGQPSGVKENPYQCVMRTIGATLSGFDDDGLIPAFGFGDSTTTDRSVFPFFPDRPARGFHELLQRYAELTPKVIMSGPTSFAPAIEAAMAIVKQTRQYHILLVIADGQVTNATHTANAIVKASELPLSIVIVGVGDGIDMAAMTTLDDGLPQRAFDNIQFVKWTEEMSDVQFAVAALQEVPDQFMAIRELGML